MQNKSYFYESRSQTEQTQESKRNNNELIGKKHADKQSKMEKNHRSGKGEKEEEIGREKKE